MEKKNKSKKTNQNNKIRKEITRLLIIILLLIFTLIIFSCTSNKVNNQETNRNYEHTISKLERKTIESFVKDNKIKELSELYNRENKDKDKVKVLYVIDNIKDKKLEQSKDKFLEIYNEIFTIDENTKDKIYEIYTLEDKRKNEEHFNNLYSNVEILKEIKKINNDEYEVKIDILKEIDEFKVREYYLNLPEEERKNEKNNKIIKELFDEPNFNNLDTEKQPKKTDLIKYIDESNYKKIGSNIDTFIIKIKIEDDGIKISDFE